MKSELDCNIERQVMAVARLVRNHAPEPQVEAARQALAGLVLRRHVERAMAKAGVLSAAQRAEAAAVILGRQPAESGAR